MQIFTENYNIGEATFEILIGTTVVEEPTWEDYSSITINFVYTYEPVLEVIEVDNDPIFDPESTSEDTLEMKQDKGGQ